MHHPRPLSPYLLCLGLLLPALGCGGGPTLVPVAGKVLVAGKPLQTGTVTYHPDASKGNKGSFPQFPMGTVGEDGGYTLATGGKPGAPAGWYKVTVRSAVPSDPKNPYSMPKSLIDPVNSKPETTNLSVEVKPGAAPDAYDLKLTK